VAVYSSVLLPICSLCSVLTMRSTGAGWSPGLGSVLAASLGMESPGGAAKVPAMHSSAQSTGLPLIGVDFSSSPSKRKPITLAQGQLRGQVLLLQGLRLFDTLAGLGDELARPEPWVGGFDFPFGLPRELVLALGWPTDWLALMQHYCALPRAQIRAQFAAFCAARPVGGKFAHRACDLPAGSSPSMKWVNPPVAYMLHAGVPLLLQAGALLPGLHAGLHFGDRRRVALEAYPGLLARELLGRRSLM